MINIIKPILIGYILIHDPSVPYADWLMSLHMPDRPTVSCCGPSDQFYADKYQENPDNSFEVWVNGEQIHVPNYKVNWNEENPTGRGVIFLSVNPSSAERIVYCFVPAIGM